MPQSSDAGAQAVKELVDGTLGLQCDTDLGAPWAAQMFIDINTKQTRVRRDHQLIIEYELGSLKPRPLAAGMLLKLNERGVLENRFKVDSMAPPDAINITTIVTTAKNLFDVERLRRVSKREQWRWLRLVSNDAAILQSGNEGQYFEAMVACGRKFFAKVRDCFAQDWNAPDRSALISAKYFAALFETLRFVLRKGKTWDQVDSWIARARQRSWRMSGKRYRDQGLAFAAPEVPGRKHSVRQIADHLLRCGR